MSTPRRCPSSASVRTHCDWTESRDHETTTHRASPKAASITASNVWPGMMATQGCDASTFEFGLPRKKWDPALPPSLDRPPAAVYPARRLIMQPSDVDGHSLQQMSSSLPHRFIAAQGELVEKLLMAVDGSRRTRRAKLVRKKIGLAQAADYNPPCSGSA
jgi:hypothetical protein